LVIWFAHNEMPHYWNDDPESWLSESEPLFSQIDAVVHLTETARSLPVFTRLQHLPSTVHRHPHYELVDPSTHRHQAGKIRRLLLIRGTERRKNAAAALKEIQHVPGLTAVITGESAAEFEKYSATEFLPGLLTEEELFDLFDGRSAVLLNQPRQLNSGVMFLALSRGAPVICPDTPVNRELRSLVGSNWIRLFNPPLTSSEISELIREPVPEVLPNLDSFEPKQIATTLGEWLRDIVGNGH
jgi:hypothetical protein